MSKLAVAVVAVFVAAVLSGCAAASDVAAGSGDRRTAALASASATEALILMRTAVREAGTATFTAEIGATMVDVSVVAVSAGTLDVDAYNAVVESPGPDGGLATHRVTRDGQFMKPDPKVEFWGEGWYRTGPATGTVPFDPRAYLSMLSTVTVDEDHGTVGFDGQEVRHLTVSVPARDMLTAQYGAAIFVGLAAAGQPDGSIGSLRPTADVWIRVEDALPVRVLLDDGTGGSHDYRYGGWGSSVSIPTPKELVEPPF